MLQGEEAPCPSAEPHTVATETDTHQAGAPHLATPL